ncbi:helix-turn-helix domain-containing protein [Thermoactinomyces mirandus]|uniref:helix-turn-helix domain-containing protein n=1 Tax=Thermoactinomyces mirandus TaxID=2756294 RepID=UPI0028B2380E|nr:helix-turn-helix domain-containing protein [Thermoactinomyces mirandus]
MEIGRRLRNAREARGLTLHDIERRTRISRRDLIAIEQGRFDFHANPVYVRSYIRAYANAVGENPQLILNQLHKKQETVQRIRRSDQNARQFLPTASNNMERTAPPRRLANRHERPYHSGREHTADGASSYGPRGTRSQHLRSAREPMRFSETTAVEEKRTKRLSRREESYSRRSRRRGTKKSVFEKVYTWFLLIGAILLVIASIWFIWFRMVNA